ncbi:MAG: hypothetical protein K9N55_09410 [Phycisphaerae bacterium]|nr:hypothetical protein [Phycisphaerae bacterium]
MTQTQRDKLDAVRKTQPKAASAKAKSRVQKAQGAKKARTGAKKNK